MTKTENLFTVYPLLTGEFAVIINGSGSFVRFSTEQDPSDGQKTHVPVGKVQSCVS